MLRRQAGLVTCTLLAAGCQQSGRGDGMAGLAFGSPGGAPAVATSGFVPARVAELYFTTEVSGYVEPCGCTSRPLGGIQRLATVLQRGRPERALVDAGDLLFPPGKIDDFAMPQHLLKARMLARAFRMMGVSALNVAESDLAGGAELLRELQREGAVPFVSSNVRPAAEGGASIAQSFLREVGGIKIGITGVATPEKLSGVDGLTAIEYAPVVRAELTDLRKRGAEVVVVLAHLGDAGARDLARAVPGIDVIIEAPGTPINREPRLPDRVGDTVIAEAGSQGQHVGRITFRLGPTAPARPLALDDGGKKQVRRQDLNERKIQGLKREIEAWKGDATKAEAIRSREAEIARLEQAAAAASAPAAIDGPSLKVELLPLGMEIPSDPRMTELLSAYYAQLREMNASKGDTAACEKKPEAASYVGTEACKDCHEEAYAFWRKTKHAAAWATLEKENKHFDLTCIGCHTIGYRSPGGFCRLKDVGVLKDVGCESCHGAGSIHVKDQDSGSITLAVNESTCKQACHVPEHSDTFTFAKYVKEITGPGHTLRAAAEASK